MDMLFDNVLIGLGTALSPTNLLFCLIGAFLGMLVGVIPGVGALSAISMLFPLTFGLEPTTALIMLAGLFYGTAYGGSTASILLNLPGGPSNAVTCLDGYPMAQQGRGGVALLLTTTSSFIAGSIGILLMMLLSPVIVSVAYGFQSAEYFALMLLGLIGASTVSDGSAVKSLAMVVLGLLLGCVGLDIYTGVPRLTFGMPHLYEGLSLVALAMGLFGIAEVIATVGKETSGQVMKVSLRSMIPSRDDLRRSWLPTLRGSGIGSLFGALPGTGAAVAAFMSYAVEKKVARDPSRFGKGAVEGICAPEAANNAADQTAFIPTMTLGIPGSATMALILGVLIIHGITPGPQLITEKPDMFWGLVMSFWIGNLILLVLNIPLIGMWIRILLIPYHLLYPAVLMFVCVGVYGVSNSPFDVWVVAACGAAGYLLRVLGLPATPLLLGFVLGPLMEEHFRRAMILSRGDLTTFIERPVSGVIMFVCAGLLAWTVVAAVRQTMSKRRIASHA